MKTYVYPAVLQDDKNGEYYVSIPDLGLLTVGESKEDAFVKGKDSLLSYFELAEMFNTDIPEPSTYDKIKANNPKYDVVMLDVTTNKETEELLQTDEAEEYKKFMKLFFDEGN